MVLTNATRRSRALVYKTDINTHRNTLFSNKMAIATLRPSSHNFRGGVSNPSGKIQARVRCSAATPLKTRRRNPNPNPMIIDPAVLSPVTARPPVPNDPALKSNWSHRAWLAGGCSTVGIALAKSVVEAGDSQIWLEPVLAGYIGYVLADLGSGVYHWAIDNYGSGQTPLFGGQIEAFQGHHKWPWTITRRQFANNLHALARAITFAVLPLDIFCNDAVWLGFIGVCSGCIMFSQQFHAWAHTTKSRLPPVVAALQDGGVLVSKSQHAAHHREPYNNNYCIVSGMWNEYLDAWKVFEAMEMVIFFQLGVRPRSWSQTSLEWREEIEIIA